MALVPAKSPPPGEILKPFVFLDLFDHEGAPFNGPPHPHSGIATLSYVLKGAVSSFNKAAFEFAELTKAHVCDIATVMRVSLYRVLNYFCHFAPFACFPQ